MWVGGEARGREEKWNASSDGGPEVLKRSCWHGGQRPFSSMGATTSRFPLWEAPRWCSDAGRYRTHIHAQPDTTVALIPAFTMHPRPHLCLFLAACVFNHHHEFMFLVVGLLVSRSVLRVNGQQHIFHRRQANCVMHGRNDERLQRDYEMRIYYQQHLNTEAQRHRDKPTVVR